MTKHPPLIGTSTRSATAPTGNRPRVLIDGRELPGVVAADPARCIAIVNRLDDAGNPIVGPDGTPIRYRRAGRIEILEGDR